MNTVIEKYCAQYVSSCEGHDEQGMNEAVNGAYRAISTRPEMILRADLEAVVPLAMMVSDYDMGMESIEMAYYVVLKNVENALRQDDMAKIETYVGLCIAFILENYDSLNRILIARTQCLPFYHLDCQLQSLFAVYCDFVPMPMQSHLRNKIEERCYFGWQNKDRADEMMKASTNRFFNSYKTQLRENMEFWY